MAGDLRLKAVGAFFNWLALAAPDALLAEEDTLDIADPVHHPLWLGNDPLYQ